MCLCWNLQQGDNSIYTDKKIKDDKKLYPTQIMATSIQLCFKTFHICSKTRTSLPIQIPQASIRRGQKKMNKRKLLHKWRQDLTTPVILILSRSFTLQFISMRSDNDKVEASLTYHIFMTTTTPTTLIQNVYHFIIN